MPGVDVRFYASDISQRMLSKARQGCYREASFRETERSLRDRYFVEKDGLWQKLQGDSVRSGSAAHSAGQTLVTFQLST